MEKATFFIEADISWRAITCTCVIYESRLVTVSQIYNGANLNL